MARIIAIYEYRFVEPGDFRYETDTVIDDRIMIDMIAGDYRARILAAEADTNPSHYHARLDKCRTLARSMLVKRELPL